MVNTEFKIPLTSSHVLRITIRKTTTQRIENEVRPQVQEVIAKVNADFKIVSPTFKASNMATVPPIQRGGVDDIETGYKRMDDHGDRLVVTSTENFSSNSTPPSPRSRRATLARQAYHNRDVDASVKAHFKPIDHDEHGNKGGEYIKTVVFGGLDGITTIFAFLMGACGADLAIESVVALGVAQLVAGALAMAMGDYLSDQADADVGRMEMEREQWEVENNPEGEVNEMVQIYMNKGLSLDDAFVVARTLAKYEDFWIEHMMLTEIGIIPEFDSPAETFQKACIMFSSFFLLGGSPLLVYTVGVIWGGFHDLQSRVVLSCVGSGIPLLILGAIKAKSANNPVLDGALAMLAQGGVCAVGAFVLATYAPAWFGFGSDGPDLPTVEF